jgi:pyruvate ferredoxin oxidoreductase alpha subunit
MAHRIAEDPRVLLPVIVNLDGFYLSFTREPVTIPDIDRVRSFLPTYQPTHAAFRASRPIAQGVTVLGGFAYSFFRYQVHLAARNALAVHDEVAGQFADTFGRRYGAIEAYELDDADYVLVMAGSFATKAKAAIRALRGEGKRIGLLRLRLIRPFPATAIASALAGRRAVAVIDQNLSPGLGGILFQDLAGALIARPDRPTTLRSFVGGLGGKDLSLGEFRHIVDVLETGRSETAPGEPELLFTESEWRQVQSTMQVARTDEHGPVRETPVIEPFAAARAPRELAEAAKP